MTAGNLFFFVCAVACIVGAIVTVAARNPIRSAVGLLTSIVGIAGLFLALDAQFLAAIQLIVYAGAVVVLFVFVIMLLGPDAGGRESDDEVEPASRVARGFSVFVVAAMLVASVVLLVVASETATVFEPVTQGHGTVEAVGGLLFSEGLVPFELVTILLIVAAVGAIAVARTKPSGKKPSPVKSPTRRMFQGPVAPRGAPRTPGGLSTHTAGNLVKEPAE